MSVCAWVHICSMQRERARNRVTSDVVSPGKFSASLSNRRFPGETLFPPGKLSTSIGGEVTRWSSPPFTGELFPAYLSDRTFPRWKWRFPRWSYPGKSLVWRGIRCNVQRCWMALTCAPISCIDYVYIHSVCKSCTYAIKLVQLDVSLLLLLLSILANTDKMEVYNSVLSIDNSNRQHKKKRPMFCCLNRNE